VLYGTDNVAVRLHNTAQRDGKILDDTSESKVSNEDLARLAGGRWLSHAAYAERFLRLSGRQMDPPQGRVWSVYRRRMK